MKKPDIKTIRKAVCENRGGLDACSDAQILTLWNRLPADLQKQYIDSQKKGKDNAVSSGPDSDLPDRPGK